MSKFVTYYNLCPIKDTNELLGLSPDWEDGNIIVTLGRNMVLVIQISTQKQIRSWSVLEKLTSKVVFDLESKQYIGVFANRYIRCWDVSVADVNKCKKLKFNKSIADIICDGTNIFILYGDGSCESLTSAINTRKDGLLKDDRDISVEQSKIFTLLDGRKILTYFVNHARDPTVCFIKKNICRSKETKFANDEVKINLCRGNQNVTLRGYTVIEGQNMPQLLTLWSDGRLFLLELTDNISSESSPGTYITVITVINLEKPISILGVSKNFLAIYGANNEQEGASLFLYNTQFQVIKAKQFFKIYFDRSRLWVVNSYILLALGQNLSVVSYKTTKDHLSELIGTHLSNDAQALVESDFINEEYPLEHCIEYHSIEPSFTGTENCGQNGKTLLDTDNTLINCESVDQFNKDLKLMTKTRIHVDVLHVDKTYYDSQIKLMSNYNDDGFVTSEIDNIAFHLETSGASEHEITEKLLHILIKCNLVKDVAVCLRRYTNVSEKMLAKTLKYSLSGFEEIESKQETQEPLKTANQMDVDINYEMGKINSKEDLTKIVAKDKADLLNIILSCSFNADSLSVHIRREIDYDNVLIVLEHLYKLITSDDCLVEERPESLDVTGPYFELGILRWFGIFLNTHFQKLALSKDAKLLDILSKWQELFSFYQKEIESLEILHASLHNIFQKRKVKREENYSKWYSIEEVVLY